MPIKKENRRLYPPDWKDIRKKILERASHCCEFCGLKNYSVGYRDKEGVFHEWKGTLEEEGLFFDCEPKTIKIVLTIAHLDHDPTNNDEKNLRALCQKCHINHDKYHHAENARTTREEKMKLQPLF